MGIDENNQKSLSDCRKPATRSVDVKLALAVLEYLYRRFLSTLPAYENADIHRNLTMRQRQEDTDTRRLLLVTVLSLVLAVLLVINLFQTITDWSAALQDTNAILLIVVTAVMVAYIIYFFVNALSVLLERRKEQA